MPPPIFLQRDTCELKICRAREPTVSPTLILYKSPLSPHCMTICVFMWWSMFSDVSSLVSDFFTTHFTIVAPLYENMCFYVLGHVLICVFSCLWLWYCTHRHCHRTSWMSVLWYIRTCSHMCIPVCEMRHWSRVSTNITRVSYDTFHSNRCTPKFHQIEKFRFLGISQYKIETVVEFEFVPKNLSFWIWWVSGVWHFQWNLP